MITSIDVANTFIHKANEENIDVNHMKLQKLIYILYKAYLKETHKQLFQDEFMTWETGPVVYYVYMAFSHYKSNAIKDYYNNYEDGTSYEYSTVKGCNDFNRIFEKVWNTYKVYSATYLAQLTKGNKTAWAYANEKHHQYLSVSDIFSEPDYVL